MASTEELMSELIKVSKKVDQLDYIKTKIDEFGKSLEFLNAKYDEQKKEIDRLKIENQNIKAKNVELEKDMNDLEGKNNVLQKRIEEIEQYSRRNNVEICGIPESVGENTETVVIKLSEKLGQNINNDDIDICHRVPLPEKSGKKQEKPSPIVVRFVRRKVRNELMASARARRIKANVINSQFSEDPIYVNEHLTPENKQLLGMSRTKKKQLKWAYCWVKDGKILMRKGDNSRIFRISKEEDLIKLK